MIPIIGRLYRRNVVTYCYGRALYNQSVLQIMKTHRYVRQIAKNELSEFESYPILEALGEERLRLLEGGHPEGLELPHRLPQRPALPG